MQEYVLKQVFDIVFAASGLFVLMPVIMMIAVAIKLDSPGPVLYQQDRTATFGETFSVYKFRSMIPDAEAETGVKLSEEDTGGIDPRVTQVGRVLRATHLDEIPQLWSILRGDMSVVGPRPERPEIDMKIKTTEVDWSKRWFIQPGLTGLAQINGATGHEPRAKLRYDIQYVREQSFIYDMKIVIRQIWMVILDIVNVLFGRSEEDSDE
jgi:lipopolysaccharide/colanic/teichoic acid biosynthesis glycosyltransferase